MKGLFVCLVLLAGLDVCPPPKMLLVEQEKPVLNLYYSSSCPYSRKVLDYLNEIHKKVPLTEVRNNPKALEYLQSKGGKLQVPCLFIDGRPLYDSDEIIDWLSKHREDF